MLKDRVRKYAKANATNFDILHAGTFMRGDGGQTISDLWGDKLRAMRFWPMVAFKYLNAIDRDHDKKSRDDSKTSDVPSWGIALGVFGILLSWYLAWTVPYFARYVLLFYWLNIGVLLAFAKR